jgi:hypothetical protein
MIFSPNSSLTKANKAKTTITKKYGKNEWYVSAEVRHNREFGYFLNVYTKKNAFDTAKETLPLTTTGTFILVEAAE